MEKRTKYFWIIGIILIVLANGCSSIEPKSVNMQDTKSFEEAVLEITKDAVTPEEKVEKIFYFVRDKILFDFVGDNYISAEEVLATRRGSCMNKAALFVKMAKESGIPARFHFMSVSKEALRDLLHPLAYRFWPDSFTHTFPEVKLNGKWISMEATFDKELHEILLKKSLNFARYPHKRDISLEFSKSGIIGAQQLSAVEGREPIYADNLTPLKEMEETISWIKLKILRPLVLSLSRRNLKKLRED
jgi:transglutaminase-like putative cysteine protease